VLDRECARVALAQRGERNDVLNRASFNLHQFVAAGLLPAGEVNERLRSAAVVCELEKDDGLATVCATIESGATAGLKLPRGIPEPRGWHGADGGTDAAPASPPLTFCDIGAWAAQEPPLREWAVPDRFPLRNVALLSGEGSVGKTIALMQLHAAHVLKKTWLDTLPVPGPTIYFNAEDEEGELHRRFASIAAYYDGTLTDLKNGGLNVLSLAGHDAVLGWSDRNGIIRSTRLFEQLKEAASDIRPKLIGLDTAADIFAGNENDRAQVRQFIGLLRSLAITANAAVVVCAHPSLTGINTGSGLSGSTAWHNSVRARAYLRHVKTDSGIEPDQTLRQLEFMKSNYGPIAATTTLRWIDHVFVLEPKAGSLEKLASDAKAEAVFLQLVERYNQEGRTVGDKNGHSYAPTQFAKEPEAKDAGLRKEALADAMRRLFAAKKIHIEQYGRPSNQHRRIVTGPPQ
jgi:RecA-family ATPase